jgi:hypothetical protein
MSWVLLVLASWFPDSGYKDKTKHCFY